MLSDKPIAVNKIDTQSLVLHNAAVREKERVFTVWDCLGMLSLKFSE